MKNMILIRVSIILLSSFLLISCKGGKHADLSAAAGSKKLSTEIPATSGGPNYLENIKPIFEKSCKMCHGTGSPNGDWLNYQVAYSKRAVIKKRVFVDKNMPMGGTMDDATRKLIAEWVDNGAPEKGSGDAPAQPGNPVATNPTPTTPAPTEPVPTTPPVTPPVVITPGTEFNYVEHIKPLFERACKMCHNESSSIPNWMLYENVVAKKDKIMNDFVVTKRMPLGGYPAVTEDERNMVKVWIEKGLKYDSVNQPNPAPAPIPAPEPGPAPSPAPAPVPAPNPTEPNPTPSDKVSFQRDLLPVIKAKCSMCHNENGPLLNWLSYSVAYKYKTSIWDRVVVKRDMPMGSKLESEEVKIFKLWIEGGSLP